MIFLCIYNKERKKKTNARKACSYGNERFGRMHESIIQSIKNNSNNNACMLNNHFSVEVYRHILHGFHAHSDSLYLSAILRHWIPLYPLLAKRPAIYSTGTGMASGAGNTFISFQRVC
jgi:hypothetical protein